ncbi:MAG: urease accessory protein ureD [Betaproteobacteria bacterium HGW-Betaproteobacteria-8]|nr:MAG: urease accessory protein ureD [Betaproteobacteria bacterium HGW-Betaproteobacteria-8]
MNQIASPDVLTEDRLQKSLAGWQAELKLDFACRRDRTVLVKRVHHGPLVIQKVLYPESDAICHGVIVHPPGGVAGGDQLSLQVNMAEGARVLLTTPGAGKWYKSGGRNACQRLRFSLSADSCLEWLPQENILFDGADVHFAGDVALEGNAAFAGWEILCFGRQASGERWQQGRLRQRLSIRRDGRLIWQEQANITPESRHMTSIAGLRGQVVSGSFVIAAAGVPREILETCRQVTLKTEAIYGVTALPEVFSARYLGQSSQEARNYFESLWQVLRPWYGERAAVRPRIWAT